MKATGVQVSWPDDGCHPATHSVRRTAGAHSAAAGTVFRVADSAFGCTRCSAVDDTLRLKVGDIAEWTRYVQAGMASSSAAGNRLVRLVLPVRRDRCKDLRSQERRRRTRDTGSAVLTDTAKDLVTEAVRTDHLRT